MNQQPKQPVVDIPAAGVMVKGLKADFHVQRNQLKRQKCPFDAGFDIYPARSEPEVIRFAGCVMFKISTCVHFCFPPGSFGYLTERSSTCEKLDGARIRTGIFDSGYTGEVIICVMSVPDAWEQTLAAIKRCQEGDVALAQMIVLPTLHPMFQPWQDQFVPGGRGANGFGHSDLFVK